MAIRTFILEHETSSRDLLFALIAADPAFQIIGYSDDGEAAVKVILELRPDLIVLDVDIPGSDGFELLNRISAGHAPEVIFVSDHPQYATKAFDVQAVDFVTKPYTVDRLSLAFSRARGRLLQKNIDSRERLSEVLHQPASARRLAVHVGRKIVIVPIEKIEWVEASGNNVKIHCGKEEYVMRGKISDIQKKLAGSSFVRIHRSLIANVEKVAEVQPCGRGEFIIVMSNGKELPLSKSYRHDFEASIAE